MFFSLRSKKSEKLAKGQLSSCASENNSQKDGNQGRIKFTVVKMAEIQSQKVF